MFVRAQKPPGRPNEITTLKMINKIQDMVLNDPKVKVREIVKIESISTECVVNILHTDLCMRKLCTRWVPRFLTIGQTSIRVTTSEQNLAYFNRILQEFKRRFVTIDETWIHHYTPELHKGSSLGLNRVTVQQCVRKRKTWQGKL